MEFRSNFRGRTVMKDFPDIRTDKVPDVGIRKGDRLDPSPDMLDTQQFDDISEFPITLVFWRPTANERCYHRNPLLNATIGTGLHTFAIDELHALHLGVFKVYVAHVFWILLLANVFEVSETLQEDK
eukprot:6483375-Pyramimonas_sp.AAC.1